MTGRIKTCGLTREQDVRLADRLGVDAIGFIFAERSRRHVTVETARLLAQAAGPFVTTVGVFESPNLDDVHHAIDRVGLDVVQLHGTVDACWLPDLDWRTRLVRGLPYHPELDPTDPTLDRYDAVLLDGLVSGAGETFNWAQAQAWKGDPRLILAGGLHAGNVATAIQELKPAAVDVASGVESEPGVKDPARMQAFVEAARAAFAEVD